MGSTQRAVHNVQYTTSSTQLTVHNGQYTTCSTQRTVHNVQYTTYSTRLAVHNVHYTTGSTPASCLENPIWMLTANLTHKAGFSSQFCIRRHFSAIRNKPAQKKSAIDLQIYEYTTVREWLDINIMKKTFVWKWVMWRSEGFIIRTFFF